MTYNQSMMGNIAGSIEGVHSFSADAHHHVLENRIRELEALIGAYLSGHNSMHSPTCLSNPNVFQNPAPFAGVMNGITPWANPGSSFAWNAHGVSPWSSQVSPWAHGLFPWANSVSPAAWHRHGISPWSSQVSPCAHGLSPWANSVSPAAWHMHGISPWSSQVSPCAHGLSPWANSASPIASHMHGISPWSSQVSPFEQGLSPWANSVSSPAWNMHEISPLVANRIGSHPHMSQWMSSCASHQTHSDPTNSVSVNAMHHVSNFPKADVIETKDNYQFQLEIPGFTPDNVSVTQENNVLTVRGYRCAGISELAKSKNGKGYEEMNVVCNERSGRGFIRQFAFPESVSEKGIEATIRNGLLTVIVNKGAAKNAAHVTVRQAN